MHLIMDLPLKCFMIEFKDEIGHDDSIASSMYV